MPVLPWSRNIGPWNAEGKPTNKFDEVALEHDRAYGNAKDQKDVDNADDQFIGHYLDTVAKGPVELFHKTAGLIGIGAKRVASAMAGRKRAQSESESRPRKTARADSDDEAPSREERSVGDAEEASGGGGGGGGGEGGGPTLFQLGESGWSIKRVTYKKTFYQHFPNYRTGKKLEPEYTANGHFSKCQTAWFNLPLNVTCMYMDAWQMEKEAFAACAYRITGGSVSLTDFTALNDHSTTVGGAAQFVTTPTNQPYFFVCEDDAHRLPYYATSSSNEAGRTPICDTREHSQLTGVDFIVNRPGNWADTDKKWLTELY